MLDHLRVVFVGTRVLRVWDDPRSTQEWTQKAWVTASQLLKVGRVLVLYCKR